MSVSRLLAVLGVVAVSVAAPPARADAPTPPSAPSLSQPGLIQPGLIQPGLIQPGLSQADAAQADAVKPGILHLPTPGYPPRLRASGNDGWVKLTVRVKADGTLERVWVVESDHPEFEAAALDAIFAGKYRPVAGTFGQLFRFTMGSGPRPGGYDVRHRQPDGSYSGVFESANVFGIPAKASSDLPEALRYDIPPRPKLVVGAVWPHDLLRRGVTGQTQVAFVVAPDGRVRETRVIDASHAEFGHAAAAMFEGWRFIPAQKDGQPSSALLHHTVRFDFDDRDTAPDSATRKLLDRLTGKGAPLATADQLDHLPTARFRVAPVRDNRATTALKFDVEIVVDETGRVRLPRVLNDRPEYADPRVWRALTAAARWRFDPPRIQGKAVAARLVLPFEFAAPAISTPAIPTLGTSTPANPTPAIP